MSTFPVRCQGYVLQPCSRKLRNPSLPLPPAPRPLLHVFLQKPCKWFHGPEPRPLPGCLGCISNLSFHIVRCYLSSCLCVCYVLLQEKFNSTFLDSADSFMDQACAIAREHVRRVLAAQPTPQKRQAAPAAPVRKAARQTCVSAGTWWTALGFETKEDALDKSYKKDETNGVNMTGKCFSSRLYGRLKNKDLQLARQAHRDADRYFAELQS